MIFSRTTASRDLCVARIERDRILWPSQSGTVLERQERLINHLLDPLESEWIGSVQRAAIIPRIKTLRMKILLK